MTEQSFKLDSPKGDMPKRTKKVFSYQRFSSGNQVGGSSLERQEKIFRGEFEREYKPAGYVFDGSFIDKGVSGFRSKNVSKGQLGKILDFIKKKTKIRAGDIIAIESIDRFSRDNPIDAIGLIVEFVRKYEIKIDFLDRSWIPPLTKKNIESHFTEIYNDCRRAHEESKRKSNLIKETQELKRQDVVKGKIKFTGTCPSWCSPVKERVKGYKDIQTVDFDLIPEKAKVVRLIFKLALTGLGAGKILSHLEKKRIKPMTGKKNWSKGYLEKILRWPATIGVYQPKVSQENEDGKPIYSDACKAISNYYPKVIAEATFYAVQKLKGRKGETSQKAVNKSKDRTSNLFAGILRCGYGQGAMNVNSKSANKTSSYYPNQIRLRPKRDSDITNGWEVKSFEKEFVHFVHALDWGMVLQAASEKREQFEFNRTNELEEKIDAIDSKLRNLIDAIAEAGLSAHIKKRVKELEKEKAPLVEKLEYEQERLIDVSDSDNFEIIMKAKKAIKNKSMRRQLMINIRDRIESIEVFGNGWQWSQATFGKALKWVGPEWMAKFMDCNEGEKPQWEEELFPNIIIRHGNGKRYSGKRKGIKNRFFCVNFKMGGSIYYLPNGVNESGCCFFYDDEPSDKQKAGLLSMAGSYEREINELNPRALGEEIQAKYTRRKTKNKQGLDDRKRKNIPATIALKELRKKIYAEEEKQFRKLEPKQQLFKLIELEKQSGVLKRSRKALLNKLKKRFPIAYKRWASPK